MSEILLITLPPIAFFLICVGCCTALKRKQMQQRMFVANQTPVFVPGVPTIVSEPVPVSYAPPLSPGIPVHSAPPVFPTQPQYSIPSAPPMIPTQYPVPSAPPMLPTQYPIPSAPPAQPIVHPMYTHMQGVGGQGYYAPNL
jgi:hypothetical protein